MLLKVRTLLGKFAHSVAAKTELGKWTTKALIHSCPTRWWSEFDSVQRIQDILDEDEESFAKVCDAMNWQRCAKCIREKVEDCPHLRFDEDDLILMKKFLQFFSEFKAKSDVLGGEAYTNIHLVFPYCKELSAHISSFCEDDLLSTFASYFLVDFLDYFSFIIDVNHEGRNEFQPYYIACSMLSPLYYNGLSEEERDVGKKFLLEELKKMDAKNASLLDDPDVEANVPKPSVNIPGLKHFSKSIDSSSRKSSSSTFNLLERKFRKDMEILELDAESTLEELQTQRNTEKIVHEDPTLYWTLKEEKYNTKLPILACDLLAAPSSSVPSERLFSIASLLSAGRYFI